MLPSLWFGTRALKTLRGATQIQARRRPFGLLVVREGDRPRLRGRWWDCLRRDRTLKPSQPWGLSLSGGDPVTHDPSLRNGHMVHCFRGKVKDRMRTLHKDCKVQDIQYSNHSISRNKKKVIAICTESIIMQSKD